MTRMYLSISIDEAPGLGSATRIFSLPKTRRHPLLEKALAKLPERPKRRGASTVLRKSTFSKKSKEDIGSTPYAPDARARALLRGKRVMEADLARAGGAYDPEQAREFLNGISTLTLDERVADGSVLAVPGPDDRPRYPTLQFGPEGLLPGLKDVRRALPTRNAWAVLNFLVNADHRLGGRRPIDVLREGEIDLVVSAARSMGLQGG